MVHVKMRFLYLAAMIVLPLFLFGACADDDDDDNAQNSTALEESISITNLMDHLQNLETIATNCSGHRAAGTQGYDESLSYITSSLATTDLIVSQQTLTVRSYQETAEPVLEMTDPTFTEYSWQDDYVTLTYSPSGDVQAEISFVDPMIPPGETESSSSDGCEEEDFDSVDVNGKIAVIQRGDCTFDKKAKNAQQHGAVAVLIFNEGQPGRQNAYTGTMSENSTVTIPVLSLSYSLGEALHTLVQSGQTVRLHVVVTASDELVDTSNVIAETPAGDGNQVVMMGAHLDSVTAGPGINDNGSGSAALLELALQMENLNYQPANKIRFAWWTAEEEGLIGSFYYLDDLQANDPQQLDRIALYLNFDMIGSPNYIRGVLDSDQSTINSGFGPSPAGSTEVEQVFLDYFAQKNLATVPVDLSGSDHIGFFYYDIPIGGLFTGAGGAKNASQAALFGGTIGEPYDACYHTPCDTTANINQDIYLENVKAIAAVTQYLGDHAGSFYRSVRMITPREQISGKVMASDPRAELLHKDRLFRPIR